MAGGNGGDIIIKGGSVELTYDESVYPKNGADPKKHKNDSKKITRIVVTSDTGTVVYDSGDQPGGLSYTITTTCK